MTFRSQHSAFCKICGRDRRDDELFSARGKCFECSHTRMTSNLVEQVEHRGPAFLRWRRRVAASVGAILIEDLEDTTEDAAA